MVDKVGMSQEEVFSNDEDPVEALMALRREESAEEPAEDAELPSDDNQEEEQDLPETPAENAAEEDTDSEDAAVIDDSGETENDTVAEEDSAPAPKVRTFKADGKDYEFTEQEMLDRFGDVFGKALNFTQKTQKLAPYRKMISALEQENITSDQLDMAIDALRGDKGALANLLKMNEIDAFDLSDEELQSGYVPNQYGKDENQLDIDEVVSRISLDQEFSTTRSVIDEKWDQESRKAFAANPGMIEGLHNDIKSGLYDKVAPLAMKMKVLDGNADKSDLDYYMLAGQQITAQQTQQPPVDNQNNAAQDAESKFDQASSEAKRKRSAASTRTRADKSVTNILDDNDEAFDAWYKKLQESN